jgi:hypothetical protein
MAAGCGLEGFAEADFDGSEVVVAAGEGEAISGDGWVGLGEEVEDVAGRHGDGVVEVVEGWRDGDAVDGFAGECEEVFGGEAGASAMCLPFVLKEAGVGVDVAVFGGVERAGVVGAVLEEGAGVVLGPEAVEDEA